MYKSLCLLVRECVCACVCVGYSCVLLCVDVYVMFSVCVCEDTYILYFSIFSISFLFVIGLMIVLCKTSWNLRSQTKFHGIKYINLIYIYSLFYIIALSQILSTFQIILLLVCHKPTKWIHDDQHCYNTHTHTHTHIYIYIYIYILLSTILATSKRVARLMRCFKLGLKLSWLYISQTCYPRAVFILSITEGIL